MDASPPHTPSDPPRSLARALAWAAVIAWMGVIFWGSSQPGSAVPGRFSVIGHLVEYAVLGILVAIALAPGRPRTIALWAIAAASVYGITDELHQLLVPGRTADPLDWATDTVGAVAGVLLVLLVWTLSRRQDNSR
jgi:VanZ family protein